MFFLSRIIKIRKEHRVIKLISRFYKFNFFLNKETRYSVKILECQKKIEEKKHY